MSKDISALITQICKDQGIDYKSCNEEYLSYYNDASRLGEIYLELKVLAGEIQIISEKYNINGLVALLQDDIKSIEILEHDIIKLARKLKDKQDEQS